ncbi:MAG: type II toxin-antitoxin system RelE/ParE family toxin [Alphaproteobacteria bacterium]|nr:type II toxin-antitoxin system RelE/ParE family toxin [Alphaproteobacteria bacterium]
MNALRWSLAAERDLRDIAEWIGDRNRDAAFRIVDRIEKSIDTLKKFPELGRPGRVDGTRELVITGTSYLVIYEVAEAQEKIDIVRILHSAQRWPPKT